MNYPKQLVESVIAQSKTYKLEGFVPGQGPLDPKLMIVGEAPGRTEIENFIPFSGQAGKELMASLALAGLTREDVYITSAVRSRPYSIKERINKKNGTPEILRPNRTPSKKEVLLHAPLLDYELQKIEPALIVTVGNIGLQRLLGNRYFITEVHGHPIQSAIQKVNSENNGYQWSDKVYTIVPMYHPAAVFYNRSLADQIQQDWSGLKQILNDTLT